MEKHNVIRADRSDTEVEGASTKPAYKFGPFLLNPEQGSLSQNGMSVALTPKAFAVLVYLVEHAGELVSKDQLFGAVWPNVIVTEAALTVCIREIRLCLQDSTRQPVYIETVYKRGFRFIGNLLHESAMSEADSGLVGRDQPLSVLRTALQQALTGQRRVLFISGEAGIGKTSLLDAFLAQQGHNGKFRIAKGQCIEHHGNAEPYFPLLDAVNRLCRDGDVEIAQTVVKFAPSLLPYIPILAHLATAEPRSLSAHCLIREMAELLEQLGSQKPLIVVLDDMHWCDASTTDFLAFWARKREPAPVLLLVGLRLSDTIVSNTALRNVKQELILLGLAEQLALEFFSVADIASYIAHRFCPNGFSPALAEMLHARTDGNPLFLVNVLAQLCACGSLCCVEGVWQLQTELAQIASLVPDTLKEMIGRQFERMNPDTRTLLEAASVAGEPGGLAMRFTLNEAAAGLGVELADMECRMEHYVRTGYFLRELEVVDWPEGSLCQQYEFAHGLYQNVIYRQIPLTRRSDMHRRIAACLEQSFSQRSEDIAGKLAVHHEQAGQYAAAGRYLRRSAVVASRVGSHREAILALHQAGQLLAKLPETTERDRQELAILNLLAPALVAVDGNASAELESVYRRALTLCERLQETLEKFPVLFGLRSYYLTAGDYQTALQLAGELYRLAQAENDRDMQLEAEVGLASCYFYLGDLQASFCHALAGIDLYAPALHGHHATMFGLGPRRVLLCAGRANRVGVGRQ